MRTVRLTETHIQGLYRGNDGGIYTRLTGTEGQCTRCGCWSQVLYQRARQRVCGRHVQFVTRTRIRLTTTFACRVYAEGGVEVPPATVLRRGDTIEVAGPPQEHGKFAKFLLPAGKGFVLVPRNRWAWM